MSNVIQFPNGEEDTGHTKLLEYVKELELDDIIMIGTKDGEMYMVHTPFESRTMIVGGIEQIKMLLILESFEGAEPEDLDI